MRENRTYGSEGREPGNSTGLPYPYRGLCEKKTCVSAHLRATHWTLCTSSFW